MLVTQHEGYSHRIQLLVQTSYSGPRSGRVRATMMTECGTFIATATPNKADVIQSLLLAHTSPPEGGRLIGVVLHLARACTPE
jgi:hypothetical protein